MEDEAKDEPRDVRLQFLVTESESEAIDAWGAQNKLRSKAEVVRQLCQIGLEASDKADAVEEQKLHLLNVKRRAAREIVGIRTRLKSTTDAKDRALLMERGLAILTDIIADLVLATADISTTATRIFGPAIARRSNPEIERALYEAGWTIELGPAEPTDEEILDRLQALNRLQNKITHERE
jgi:hypothetical protein